MLISVWKIERYSHNTMYLNCLLNMHICIISFGLSKNSWGSLGRYRYLTLAGKETVAEKWSILLMVTKLVSSRSEAKPRGFIFIETYWVKGILSFYIHPCLWVSAVWLILVPGHCVLSYAPQVTHPISLLSAFISSHEIVKEMQREKKGEVITILLIHTSC